MDRYGAERVKRHCSWSVNELEAMANHKHNFDERMRITVLHLANQIIHLADALLDDQNEQV